MATCLSVAGIVIGLFVVVGAVGYFTLGQMFASLKDFDS